MASCEICWSAIQPGTEDEAGGLFHRRCCSIYGMAITITERYLSHDLADKLADEIVRGVLRLPPQEEVAA